MEFVMIVRKTKIIGHFLFVWLLLLAYAIRAEAHPHMWIDLKSELIIKERTQVFAIYQEWLLDDYFSASLIEEASVNPNGLLFGIREIVGEILDNLKPHSYFTLISNDGQKIFSKPIDGFEVEIRENRVWLSFVLPISGKVDLIKQNFSYSIFDPTYYIEMLYFENQPVTFSGEVKKGCHSKIVQPNPSTDAILLARSPQLDKVPDESIGQLFAEVVTVSCQ